MRADRLLALLLLLQNRGLCTATELAAELEVSVRTVHRDVEALGAAGVPVLAERGRTGGYRLVGGYRTRLTGLTGDEAGALFLAGVPDAAKELGLGAVLATAQLKVRAALPAELADRTRRLQERFHLDPASWFRDADPVPELARVAEAVWEQRVLRVHYRRWRGEVHRELRPLGLVLKSGIWYLLASSATPAPEGSPPAPAARTSPAPARTSPAPGNAAPPAEAAAAVRTYRVSRMLAAEVADRHFTRPPDFDLAAHWASTTRELTGMLHQDTATVRVSPRALRLLPAQFGTAGAEAARRAGPPDQEGWAVVELPVESTPVAVSDLLRLGPDAEVLAPPALRAAIAEAVAALARRYADANTTAAPS
ncbi:helix-turn-helix transcriptional regulator [Kitasatospora fiedleri]|uniref:helix-turn-helix transcriptional regulator n=1 Tax=Kitasatospora fiedleri TaxID=2991545 RepID=UPI00249A5EFA|nr:WYL domain-containing protein [Kitasatospora fiedleri]